MQRTWKLCNEPGWFGGFTREQAPGAIPNGTRVVKVRTEPTDTHPIGSLATILGSIAAKGEVFYFVEWDAHPRIAVGIRSFKIKPAPMS